MEMNVVALVNCCIVLCSVVFKTNLTKLTILPQIYCYVWPRQRGIEIISQFTRRLFGIIRVFWRLIDTYIGPGQKEFIDFSRSDYRISVLGIFKLSQFVICHVI